MCFFPGHHLAQGHQKDQDGHDPGPLKSQGRNPGLNPALHTDPTKNQRRANTDKTSLFMMLSLTGNAVLFLCLNSLFKKQNKTTKKHS